jgi:predicted metalloprotease with PDZ domain
MKVRALFCGALLALCVTWSPRASAQTATPMTLTVDATQAAQKIYHVAVTMPAKPGPFTLDYPKWIPGWHGPVGPIADVVNLRLRAGSNVITWRRDLVDFFAIHTDVPPGATSLEADFDLVGAPATTGEMDVPSTDNLLLIQWSSFLMYPDGAMADRTPIAASLKLPAGWHFGTALPVAHQNGDTVAFERVSLTTLVDSPLNAGRYFAAIPLGGEFELDVAADSAAALETVPAILTGMRHLVAEGPALYGDKHFTTYHFLLTLSEAVGANGIEHHQSSDNRAGEKYVSDAQVFRPFADLMPHEFSHSWNGKYRRPADLLVDDFQKPERTDLLWVYEGLNQYVGEVLTARSRLVTLQDQLDGLAITAAEMDAENGRAWRPIRDTADEAPLLYNAPGAYYHLRRSAGDFYTEGNLIWLDADVTIRRLSGGKRSLDDFLKRWAAGGSTAPSVQPYAAADVFSLLNHVAAYDWEGFFRDRIATVQPRAPLGGITGGGWRLVYADSQSDLAKARDTQEKSADFAYSLGLTISTDGANDGTVRDVLTDSPAFAAGLAPGMHIVAVDGRRWSADLLHQALKDAKTRRSPIALLATNGDFFRTYEVPWYGGERYPRLERVPGTPDLLTRIYAPLTFTPPREGVPAHP